MSEVTTRGVKVLVRPRYHPDRSNPQRDYWFFSYTVTIENTGRETVQLLSRHWVVTDATGGEREVRGPGVVGKRPVLAPGERFRYTSFCPLQTSLGGIRGSYEMVTDEGEKFDAGVAPFTLADPETLN